MVYYILKKLINHGDGELNYFLLINIDYKKKQLNFIIILPIKVNIYFKNL